MRTAFSGLADLPFPNETDRRFPVFEIERTSDPFAVNTPSAQIGHRHLRFFRDFEFARSEVATIDLDHENEDST